MSSRFINGAKYAVSTQLAAAIAITALSNANPAVASCATPAANGDILILQSGWTNLTEGVYRAAGQVAATSFQLEGVDTTDATRYPAGEGVGAFQKASAFVGLSQVRDVAMSGGDQNYFQYQYVEDEGGRQRQSPTFKGAMSMKVELDYDPTLPWYDALIEVDRLKVPCVLRETLPAGDVIYYVGMLAFNKVPTKGINQNMTVVATFSLQADPTRYGA
jgi:hypothetical protein